MLGHASPITYLRLTHHLPTPHPSLTYASPITYLRLTQPFTIPLFPTSSLFLASIFKLFANLTQFFLSLSLTPIKSLFKLHAVHWRHFRLLCSFPAVTTQYPPPPAPTFFISFADFVMQAPQGGWRAILFYPFPWVGRGDSSCSYPASEPHAV
jgi:hypothetical protein